MSVYQSANEIRSYASQYILEARKSGKSEVTIVSGHIVRELGLHGRVPSVCSALASKKFQDENKVVLTEQTGPPSGLSTTVKFTYQLKGSNDQFSALRGVGKASFAALGGGEHFIKSERDHLNKGSV